MSALRDHLSEPDVPGESGGEVEGTGEEVRARQRGAHLLRLRHAGLHPCKLLEILDATTVPTTFPTAARITDG